MACLPLTFQGAVRFPLNFWSVFGLRPKGFAVFLDFDTGLVPKGVQEFRLVTQVLASAPGIAVNYLCAGKADFDQGTFVFESDRPPARFTGRIDVSGPRIEGNLTVDCVLHPHDIIFVPFAG